MTKTTGLKEHCERCLNTERWNANPVLMIVDAAFTSIGLNYFKSVVPKVIEFEKKFVENGSAQSFEDLKSLSISKVKDIWANERSWSVAKSVASYFYELAKSENLNDREALRQWAAMSQLENWKDDAIGKIKIEFGADNQVKPKWSLCQSILQAILVVCIVGLIGCDWLEQGDILMEARFVPEDFDACQGKTRLEYMLLEATYVSIAIYDSAGRQVVQLADNHREIEGAHSYDWYGRDVEGDCVPAGLYIADVKAGEEKIEVTVRIF